MIVHTTKIYINRVTIILQRNTFLHCCLYTSLSKDSIYSVIYLTVNSVLNFRLYCTLNIVLVNYFDNFVVQNIPFNFFYKNLHTLKVQLISNFTYVYSYVNTMF